MMMTVFLLLLLVLGCCLLLTNTATTTTNAAASATYDMPPVYYLNLDQHVQRRQAMETHLASLQLPYFKRVAALTPQTCNLLMVESPCFRVGPMDIAILCSHMNALYEALEDPHPAAKQSPYFLLLEDDVRFEYLFNMKSLLHHFKLGSNVIDNIPDFASLQLMLSHKTQLEAHWESFLSNSPSAEKRFFTYRPRNSSMWSAQAVLYRKDAIRDFIQKAVVMDRFGQLGFKLINSFDYQKHSPYKINAIKPSVACDCLFADMFVYAMAQPAFVLNAPLFSSSTLGGNSTLHQSHVAYHAHGFALLDLIHMKLKAKKEWLPPFFVELPKDAKGFNIADENMRSVWYQIAIDNPVSGKGIPKGFNIGDQALLDPPTSK